MRFITDRDLVFLDLEATGTDPARDRIVQIAMIRLSKDGVRTSFDSYVDPEIPIPQETVAIHHITNEMVRSAPPFRALIPRLLEFMASADLGGFGVLRYDIPLLQAEFKRCGMAFDLSGRRVVDAQIIFHRLESRTLSAACEFYRGKPLEGAHDARADVAASLDVFLAEVDYYQGRSNRPDLPAEIQALADFCCAADPKNVDARGKFVWRHGVAAFNFGKHQTKSLEEVVRSDRGYVAWLAGEGAANPEVAEICRSALSGIFPKKND